MNDDNDDSNLDNLLKEMPPIPENRPGLSQLSYRIGDYDTFFRRMLAYLPQALQQKGGETGTAPLSKLTTREPDDAAIALLDAWAVVADVLTFYQERIANEGYLLTATERLSILELARSIGYELNPGVAASTSLAFTVEDAPGSPDVVLIPKGTQVMSVPMKDELPQIFETDKDFVAHREWNALKPRLYRSQVFNDGTVQLFLNGTSTQLTKEDVLLVIDQEPNLRGYLLILTEVIEDRDANHTLVKWKETLPVIPPNTSLEKAFQNPQVFAFRQRARLFGHNAPQWESLPAETKLEAIANSSDSAVAIQGGVFRSGTNGNDWSSVSKGLPNSDILCLATGDGVVYAGTPDRGIFRSLDYGESWHVANAGLSNFNIICLHVADKDSSFNGSVFAGTPNGGVFQSKDQGQNWVAINIGSVRVTGDNTNGWQSTNTSLPSTIIRSILTYSTLTKSYILVGTDQGIYYSSDQGKNWYPNQTIETTSNIKNRTVHSLSLVANKYIFAGTDKGLFVSTEIDLTDKNNFNRAKISLSNSENQENKNQEDEIFSLAAENLSSSETNYLLAGTNKGIIRFSINTNNKSITSIILTRINPTKELANAVVYSLTIKNNGTSNKQLIAATNKGIFWSNDYITLSAWGLINKRFNTQEMRAIASTEAQIFVGAKFTGFLSLDWPDLKIQKIQEPLPLQLDLETLYPQILPDIAVLN